MVGAWDAWSQIDCPTDKTRSRRWMIGMFVGGSIFPGFWCASCFSSILGFTLAVILNGIVP